MEGAGGGWGWERTKRGERARQPPTSGVERRPLPPTPPLSLWAWRGGGEWGCVTPWRTPSCKALVGGVSRPGASGLSSSPGEGGARRPFANGGRIHSWGGWPCNIMCMQVSAQRGRGVAGRRCAPPPPRVTWDDKTAASTCVGHDGCGGGVGGCQGRRRRPPPRLSFFLHAIGRTGSAPLQSSVHGEGLRSASRPPPAAAVGARQVGGI